MKKIFFYLITLLALYSTIGLLAVFNKFNIAFESFRLLVYCGIFGGIGGITYCLRGIYLNACVHNRWSDSWLPWYYIRPVVSVITGAISSIFLKAGLIVLEAKQSDNPTNLAFYALAFIAGLNVDRFLEKIEDVAHVTWGIKKSRASQPEAKS